MLSTDPFLQCLGFFECLSLLKLSFAEELLVFDLDPQSVTFTNCNLTVLAVLSNTVYLHRSMHMEENVKMHFSAYDMIQKCVFLSLFQWTPSIKSQK